MRAHQLGLLFLSFLPFTVAQTVNTASAGHYRWGDCCDGWYLVKNERLHIIQERMPPGTSGAPHLHRKAQQFFYVLKGEATLTMDGREVILRERDGVRVPPGVPHQMQNRSKQDLEFLVTSEPPSQGDRENLKAPRSRPD